jgi:hypothetical protein
MGLSREQKRELEKKNRELDAQRRKMAKDKKLSDAARKKLSKPADINLLQAATMTAAQIARELKKGKTVSGYEEFIADNYGQEMVRDVRVKDIEKRQKALGGIYHEGTVKTGAKQSIADSAREMFGNKKASPPPGRSTWW